jgi:YegS/Rv2252/BmrU family lipid kinase
VVRRRILIILNPAAGRPRSAERRLRRFIAALEGQGCSVVLRRAGSRLGDTERLAREAEADFDAIVAAGGDGTVHAVVNGRTSRPTPIGVLPLGTVNVLAREIGLPRRPEGLARLIVSAPARPIWPGRVAGRAFLMMASVGFDSETVAAIHPGLKARAGRLAFAWAMLVRLWHYRARELVVRVDGIEHRAAGLVAAKGRFYAGPFVIAPCANLAEPALELVLFRRGGRLATLRYAIALFLGLIPRLNDVAILRTRAVTVTGDEALPVQADGEIVGQLPAAIEIADQPLFLIQPEA